MNGARETGSVGSETLVCAPPVPTAAADADVARIAARLSTDYFLRYAQTGFAAAGNPAAAIIAHAILSANVSYIDHDPKQLGRFAAMDDAPPDDVRRPITISAVASSLGLPFETVRRHVARLVAAGLCIRVLLGVVVPSAAAQGPRRDELMLSNLRDLRRLFRALQRAGVRLDWEPDWGAGTLAVAERRPGPVMADAAVARIAIRLSVEYLLRTAQAISVSTGGDYTGALILRAIIAANVGYLDGDPDTFGQFAGLDDVPPDSVRRPVSVLAIAGSLDLPYETVRRRVAKLVKRGLCRVVGGGVVAPSVTMQGAQEHAGMLANVVNLRRLYRALRRAGVELH